MTVVTPLSPLPPTKPRTKAVVVSIEQPAKKGIVETTESRRSRTKREISQAPSRQPKRRRLVKELATRRTETIGEVCIDIRGLVDLSSFGYVKYDTLNDEEKSKIE